MRRLHLETFLLPAIALVSLVADQVSKSWIVAHLTEGQSVPLTPWLTPVLQLTYVTNTGAVFGLFRGMGDVFIVVAIVVVLALLFYNYRLPRGQWLMRAALGLQLGGALGNLTDRLTRGGSVVDFIDTNFWPLREWPIFNLADTSIVLGVAILAFTILWLHKEPPAPAERQTSEAT